MRIIFVSGDLCDGGAQRVMSVIANELADLGHDVHLFIFSRSNHDYTVNSKVKLFSLCNSYDDYKKTGHIWRLVKLRRYIKYNKPDVGIGFLQGGYALFFAALGMSFPKIASARVAPSHIAEKKGIYSFINRIWFKHADSIVLQNNEQMEQALHYKWRNCSVIENPLSLEALGSCICEYSNECYKFIMAGRLTNQKNYPMVISAMQRIKKDYSGISVDIFGQGCLFYSLKNEIEAAGLSDSIHLRGWCDSIVSQLISHDAYILTSNYEGMPNSLMEAMCVGLPCISTACETGPRELIRESVNGFLIEKDDSKALEDKMRFLINSSKEKRSEIGKNARKDMIDQFNPHAIAKKWEALFIKLISEKK